MVSPLEIILIIVVVIILALTVRIVRMGRVPARQSIKANKDTSGKATAKHKTASYLNRSGITLVITGIVAFIAAAGLFRWALQGYLWAFILIALGALLVVISRNKRR